MYCSQANGGIYLPIIQLAKRISLDESQISLRSNITRRGTNITAVLSIAKSQFIPPTNAKKPSKRGLFILNKLFLSSKKAEYAVDDKKHADNNDEVTEKITERKRNTNND